MSVLLKWQMKCAILTALLAAGAGDAVAQSSALARGGETCAAPFRLAQTDSSPETLASGLSSPAAFPGPAPSGATRHYETLLFVAQQVPLGDSRALTWEAVVSTVGKWAQTQKSIRFERLVEPERFRTDGEWQSDPKKSEVEARIKVETSIGSGTPQLPETWMLTLTRGDASAKGLQWMYRIVVSTTPQSTKVRLAADVHSFYDEGFAGRKRTPSSVTSLGFVASLSEKFTLTANDQSQAAKPTAPVSLSPQAQLRAELDALVVSAVQNRDSRTFVQGIERVHETIRAKKLNPGDFALTSAQLEVLKRSRELIDGGANQESLSAALRFTLALETLGHEFRIEHLQGLEARIRTIGLSRLDFSDFDLVLTLNGRVAKFDQTGHRDALSRAMSPGFLMDIEDHLYRRFGQLSEHEQRTVAPQFIVLMFKVSELVKSRNWVFSNRQEISRYVSYLVPLLRPDTFPALAHVLWNYRVLLPKGTELELVGKVQSWLQPRSALNFDFASLITFAKVLDRPPWQFIDQLANYFATKLSDSNYEWASNCLWAIWLLDPGKAFVFAKQLDPARMANLPSKTDRVTQLASVKTYFEQVKRFPEIPWLTKWLKGKHLKHGVSVSKYQVEVRELLALIFPGRTFRMEEFVDEGLIGFDIYEPSQRLDIEADGPFHYLVDAYGNTRLIASNVRRDEVAFALNYDVLRLDFAAVEALRGLTVDQVRQVVTPGTKVKHAIKELLRLASSPGR